MVAKQLIVKSNWCNKRDLLCYADSTHPLMWLQANLSAVGVGEIVRLTASGDERITQLNSKWQELVRAAQIHDFVNAPHSGLTSYGAITFAGASATNSVLIVPQVIFGEYQGRYFKTTVTERGANSADNLIPQPTPLVPWQEVALQHDPNQAETSDYLAKARRALATIDSGELKKIVLARQTSAALPVGADLRAPLKWLWRNYRNCTTFAIDGFFGATPETIVRSTDRSFASRVLAGTVRFNPEDPLANSAAGDILKTSPRINKEHDFATQSVINALAPLVDEISWNRDPLVIELPNVLHRATNIRAKIKPCYNSLDLLAAMHPTAAVAGTPTAAAVRLIGEIEDFDRARYAGAVGWINQHGDGEWALGLRCAQVHSTAGGAQITATAGGGLVAGSDIFAELAETTVKMVPISQALKNA
ncbi:chorismate-binding protein [Canibacter sp. lx-72]|uniref:isochorismate synthase n=1 Tax=Canibacter zhuwentaonis TaxID=2837491 RepID=UPI001BDBECB5|nr:chorismate-binding protein [Canibacter zhuwentaonis]MBT1018628.1 chorismate-binding protein [Canibacter zhuwentaonis]